MIKMKAGDWLILFLGLLLIPLSWAMTQQGSGKTTAIEVIVGDHAPVIYPLQEQQTIKVNGEIGDSIIEIRNGKVRMLSSPCSGKICLLSGWHRHSGDTIVCLPNKVAVSLITDQQRFDGINF